MAKLKAEEEVKPVGMTPEEIAEKERKAKAARAKKLLAKRKEKVAAEASKASSDVSETPRGSLDLERTTTNGSVAANGIPGSPLIKEKEPIVREKSSLGVEEGDGTKKPLETISEPEPELEKAKDKVDELKSNTKAGAISPTPNPRHSSENPSTNPSTASNIASPSSEALSRLRETNADLTNRLIAMETELDGLRTDSGLLSEARGVVSTLEKERAGLEERLRGQQSQLDKGEGLRNELGQVKLDLAGATERADKAETTLESLRKDLKRAEKRIVEAEEKGQTDLKEIQSRLDRQREREGGLEGEIARLKQAHSEVDSTRTDLEGKLETIKNQYDVSQRELSTLQETHAGLQSSHADLTKRLGTMTRDLAEAQTSATTFQGLNTSHSAKISLLETSLATSTTEVESLKSELAVQKKKADQAAESRGGLQKDNRELLDQLEEMRGRLGEVIKEREEAVQRSAELQKRVTEIETSLDVATASGSSTSNDLDRLRAEIESSKSDQALLRTELEASMKEVEQAENRAVEAQSTSNDAQLRMEGLREALEGMGKKLELKMTPGSGVEAILEVLEAGVNSLMEEKETGAEGKDTPAKLPSTAPENPETAGESGLELSKMASRLRTAEDALHVESTKSHNLAKQITDMQIEISRLAREREEAIAKLAEPSPTKSSIFSRSGGGAAMASAISSPLPDRRSLSPSLPSPSHVHSHGGFGPVMATRPPIDQNLPPSARQKRQVSLALLRARMGPSTDGSHLSQAHSHPQTPSRSVSVQGGDEEDEVKAAIASGDVEEMKRYSAEHGSMHGIGGLARSQFGDEAIFWCPSCEGDLITL